MGAIVKADKRFSRYKKATTDFKPRIIGCVCGEVGSGKTTWALGAPGPIGILTLDEGLEGVVEEFAGQKDIYVETFNTGQTGEDVTHAMATELMAQFADSFAAMINDMRTVIVDRETDLWNWHTYAETGTDDKFGAAVSKDWPKIKAKLLKIINMAKGKDCNLILTKGMTNEWGKTINPKTGKEMSLPTGNRIPSGMDEVDGAVNVMMIMERIDGEEETTFKQKVGKARGPGHNAVQGRTFDPALTFVEFGQLLFPDSSLSDWS